MRKWEENILRQMIQIYTELADYAVDINFDDLPEEVIERVKC